MLDLAIEYCIDALNDTNICDQKEQFILNTIEKLKALPYKGRNLGIKTFFIYGERSNFSEYINRINKGDLPNHSLGILNIILTLYDFANYTEYNILTSAQKIRTNDFIFNHIMKHIITNFAVMDDIKSAEKFIPNFRKTIIFKEEDNLDQGYLIILHYYALKGDVENFFKYFKQSKPNINRLKILDYKSVLARNYTLNNGIEKSIQLCNHKNLGTKFYIFALRAFAEQGKYNELKKIFEKHPQLKQPEQETELTILLEAYSEAKKLGYKINDDFQLLFDRISHVNRKIKCGDVKLQDSLFFDLGLSSKDNLDRFKMCRKAIKNNILKKNYFLIE